MKTLKIAASLLALVGSWSSLAAPRSSPPENALARLSATATPEDRRTVLADLLTERNLPYEAQVFEASATTPGGTNFIVDLGDGDREVLLTAHYDAFVKGDGRQVPGAVDNGAGVLVLIEAATRLRRMNLDHRVRIVFFDQEERGLIGSKAYLRANPSRPAAAVFNFDIVGYGDTVIYSAPAAGNAAVAALARACLARPCLAFTRYPSSDHQSFERAGVPATSIATLSALEAHQLWLLLHGGEHSGLRDGFQPSILTILHGPDDRPERVDLETIAQVTDLAINLAANFGLHEPAGASISTPTE